MNVGNRLKELRKRAGLSQRELAKRVGVTNSTISMIEKNNVSPSISSLEKVLAGMSMTLLEFFNSTDNDVYVPPAAYRRDDLVDVSSSQVKRYMLGQFYPNRQLEMVVETFPPGAERSLEANRESGDKAGYVVSGQLVLLVGEQAYILNEGEGFYLNAGDRHFFRNEGTSSCHLVISRCIAA